MNYKLVKLQNGLRVISVPISTIESAAVTIWVGVGSRFESSKHNGISHFLEHMVFKGSKKRPSAKKIAEAIDALGGEFNASTSKDWTNFYIKARAGVIDKALDVLSDMVLKPILRKQDIEREKGVIVEEIGMKEDTPMATIDDIFEQVIFSGNSLGMDIIGTKNTVRNIYRDDFEDYRNTHYTNENVLVTVSGAINEDNISKLCEEYFSSLQTGHRKNYTLFKNTQKKPQVFLKSKKAEQAHFMLGFLGYPRGHKSRFAEAVLSAILGGGMSSRLFTEIREKRGLAYAVKTSSEHYAETGYLASYAGVDLKRIDEAISVCLDQHYKLAQKKLKVTQTEIKRAKEYIKGHLALSLEDTLSVNSFFGIRELLLGKIETPAQIYKEIDKVKVEDVYEIASDIFKPEKLNLAIIGPYNSSARFERLLK